jgi:methyl-accepting chemotaxis protein
MGDLDFRISHNRKDELGGLFDGFNLFVSAVQERLEAAERVSGGPKSLEATRISTSSGSTAAVKAVGTRSLEGTPFDQAWKHSA